MSAVQKAMVKRLLLMLLVVGIGVGAVFALITLFGADRDYARLYPVGTSDEELHLVVHSRAGVTEHGGATDQCIVSIDPETGKKNGEKCLPSCKGALQAYVLCSEERRLEPDSLAIVKPQGFAVLKGGKAREWLADKVGVQAGDIRKLRYMQGDGLRVTVADGTTHMLEAHSDGAPAPKCTSSSADAWLRRAVDGEERMLEADVQRACEDRAIVAALPEVGAEDARFIARLDRDEGARWRQPLGELGEVESIEHVSWIGDSVYLGLKAHGEEASAIKKWFRDRPYMLVRLDADSGEVLWTASL